MNFEKAIEKIKKVDGVVMRNGEFVEKYELIILLEEENIDILNLVNSLREIREEEQVVYYIV